MADRDVFTGFNDLVVESIRDWHVPGCAVAAVRGSETLLCHAYGMREVERGLPFLTGTLFEIASLTKALTTTCLGILADRRLIDFDKPVRTYLPDFTVTGTTPARLQARSPRLALVPWRSPGIT